jgi:hypothetical protein
VETLECRERAEQRAGLAGLDTGRQQKEQRVEIVLLRDDAVFAQILRHDRRRNAVAGIGAGLSVESRRQDDQLVGIGHGEARRHMAEAVPRRAWREGPMPRVDCEFVRGEALPRHLVRGFAGLGPWDADNIGNEGFEEPAPRRVGFLLFVFAADCAQFFAYLDTEPDRIVPEDHPRAALHHLSADIE